MTIDAQVRPRDDQRTAERDRLRARLDELEAGLAELRAILADAQHREDAAHAEASRLAAEAGGTEAIFEPAGRRQSLWSFSWPHAETPAVRQAADRLAVVRQEVQPVRDAIRLLDAAAAEVRQALDRAEAEIAALEARAEQDRHERQRRWTAATTERHLPAWRDRAGEVLARLGLAEG
jgi:peptidoglycan hydrolase CwlO-like protein